MIRTKAKPKAREWVGFLVVQGGHVRKRLTNDPLEVIRKDGFAYHRSPCP